MRLPAPSLPDPPADYQKGYQNSVNRILTIFFGRLLSIGPLEGTSLRLTNLVPTSSLQHPVDSVATTFTLHDASLFPPSGFGTIGNEQFEWTGKSGNDLTGILRGQLGTVAAHHGHNTLVIASVTPGDVYADLNKMLRVL